MILEIFSCILILNLIAAPIIATTVKENPFTANSSSNAFKDINTLDEIQLVPENIFLKPGETIDLSIQAHLTSQNMFFMRVNQWGHWTSSDESILTVKDGIITAVSQGEANIRIDLKGGLHAEAKV
ncbi:MAG: Ig-like domain-containing protein, partial [Cellvibrionales bacterium]|nr:Ig-like domain-containing protein [Cellvibrionales bacterium]